jgi:hypothetical protein
MTTWTKTRSYKKWSANVQNHRKTQRNKAKTKDPLDMCTQSKTFCKGSKDIPRKLMPQIYDAAAFAKTIKTKYGVGSHRTKKSMNGLRPSQNEINEERVDSVIKDIKAKKLSHKNPIVVSEDGFIVDGHHRWAAYKKHNPELKIPVLVVEAPIKDALGLSIAVSEKREAF